MSKELATTPSNVVADMLHGVIEKGITPENVSSLDQLVGLYERMQAKDAEKQFNAAFVALQKDIPEIVAKTEIKNRGKYERFEDVMHVVKPLLEKHGFLIRFTQSVNDMRVMVTCHLSHTAGHSVQNDFTVRIGKLADSETQADCKASTTAKRNALCQALNIIIRQDVLNEEEDATIEGVKITQEQADSLRKRVKDTGSDESLFLEFANANTYEEILTGKLLELDTHLSKKERQMAKNRQSSEELKLGTEKEW